MVISDGPILVHPVPEEAEEGVKTKEGVVDAHVEVKEAEMEGREVNKGNQGGRVNKGNRGNRGNKVNREPLGYRLLPDRRE